jgi:hypothetical protein
MGANSTFLVIATGAGAAGCQLGSCLITSTSSDSSYAGGPLTVYGWTAGYTQGSNQLTLSSTSSISTKNPTILFLEQCETGYTAGSPTATCSGSATDNNQLFLCSDLWTSPGVGCSNNGPGNENAHRGQIEITVPTAVSGNVVTIADPLKYPNWTAGQMPRVWIAQAVTQVGVENMAIDDSSNGTNDIIQFFNAYQWWVSGVRLTNWGRWGVEAFQSVHGIVQNSYFYHSTGPDSYGFRCEICGDNVVQNNIMIQVFAPIVFDGASSGDVIAYNYIINDNYQSDFLRPSDVLHDVNGYELLEGNIGNQIFGGDANHGTAPMTTWYRNLSLGWDSCANGQCGATTAKGSGTAALGGNFGSRYASVVANVVGTPGFSTTYFNNAGCFNGGVVFLFGCTNIYPTDPLARSTSMWWGNWDVATGATRWCGNSSDTGWSTTCASTSEVPTGATAYPNSVPTVGDTGAGQSSLPASFYLSSKPAWFGSLAWPPIGPDVSGGTVGQCSGTLNTPGQMSGMPAMSNSQCTGTSLAAAWSGHVNAIPAMNCALNVMGMPPDGTGKVLGFDASVCYGGASPSPSSTQAPNPPTNLVISVD